MKIGLIVAMDKELQLMLPLLQSPQTLDVEGYTLYCGTIGSHEICLTKVGIGKVNAALGGSALIRAFAPQLIINSGVAGGTGSANVLDMAVATGVGYHDVWCGPGTTPGEAAGYPQIFPGAKCVLDLPVLEQNLRVKKGIMASGDIFVDTPEQVAHILSIYPNAIGCDMESGALAQTCAKYGVEFICLRVISDTPGRVADNGAQYESFWVEAPRESFALLTAIIAAL